MTMPTHETRFRKYLLTIIVDGAQPGFLDGHSLPLCAHERCRKYDGKRCELTASRPDRFCEPALVDVMANLEAFELSRKP